MDQLETDIRVASLEKAMRLIENNMDDQHNKDVAIGFISSEIRKLRGK